MTSTTTSSSTYSTISINSANNNSNELSHITKNNNIRNCSTTMANITNQNNNINNNIPSGLVVTAKQIYYPIELSNSELLSHYEMIQEYQCDIASNIIQNNSNCNPSLKLINQQPELNPHFTRPIIIEFLYKLSKLTRVTNGIFFQSMRLFDRYCSKRIVLRDQIHLILGTCLWLSAKTYGGCNHIINNVVIPTGGRFYGPNPRARIPRLNELVYFCQQSVSSDNNNNKIVLDESMFLQMERHILDTLNWEVSEPTFNDYILTVDENCLIQYESYQRQSHLPQDIELNDKIQLIHLKNFLMDLVTWKLDFLNFELFELTNVIFHLINRFTNESDQSSLLDLPIATQDKQVAIFNIFIESISNVPELLLNNYKEHPGIVQFINNVKLFCLQSSSNSKPSSLSKLSINTASVTSTLSPQSIPSPVYSTHNSTPLRNISGNSENSIFSSIMGNNGSNSPLTPSIYDKSADWSSSTNDSSLSLGKRSYQDRNFDGKENMIIPPRSKFLNTGISTNDSNHSSKTSLISLTVGQ